MRTLKQAVDFAERERNHPSQNWERDCLLFVRLCWDLPTTGTPAAADAWRKAKRKHTTGTPPKGAPVYWATSSPEDHVALSAGGGRVYSNDIRVVGEIDLVPIEEIRNTWSATYRGWSEDYCGVFDLPLIDIELEDEMTFEEFKDTKFIPNKDAPGAGPEGKLSLTQFCSNVEATQDKHSRQLTTHGEQLADLKRTQQQILELVQRLAK
jgi:hypothetical protein